MKLKIIIPILEPFHSNDEIVTNISFAHDELIALNGELSLQLSYVGEVYPKIYFEDINAATKLLAKTLIFEVDISIEKIKFNKVEDNKIEDQKIITEILLTDQFKTRTYCFLLLSQIAKPGTIKSKEGKVYCDNSHVQSFPALISIQRESYDEICALKWPKLKSLKYMEVWGWFMKNHLSFERHSKSKVERALNAFTYLFRDNLNDIVFDLIYSLIAVEALYCSNKEGISEQIFEKTQVVLGPLTDFKKRLKNMYNFRSRLIHGDLDIPPNHYDYDDDDEINYNDELFKSVALSVAIVTATFQDLVLRNKVELSFKYNLK